jgi:hypothetical protein
MLCHSARLDSTRLGSARLGSARLGSARLYSTRLDQVRLLEAEKERLRAEMRKAAEQLCAQEHETSALRSEHQTLMQVGVYCITAEGLSLPTSFYPSAFCPMQHSERSLDMRSGRRMIARYCRR